MKKTFITCTALFIFGMLAGAQPQVKIGKIEPVDYSKVVINDNFWRPKMDLVAAVTLPAIINEVEIKTPRIQNFEIAAGLKQGKFGGNFYDDSDIHKTIEAMSYSLKLNPGLEQTADRWIDIIARAQQPDGYLDTWYIISDRSKQWTGMSMHEDFILGHMIEAAIAYDNATGKDKYLNVAIRCADHFASLFGPGKAHWVTGHEELELALVKLYNITKNKKYLDLAEWLIEERGRGYSGGQNYNQDVLPVSQQTKIQGHAVRAMYLYSGVADVAAATGGAEYGRAMQKVWENVVFQNMYITGGIGAAGGNEGFSHDYSLSNESAYCETCASVGMVYWQQRLFMLTGDSRYIDVLERTLYNAALDGLSVSGDHFFYSNPLASHGQHKRSEWFSTACCPPNIARLIGSLGGYIYAQSGKDIWVNLYIGSRSTFDVARKELPLELTTSYPWEGKIIMTLNPPTATSCALHLRIPGWVLGNPVPGDLYRFADAKPSPFSILLNGRAVHYKMQQGYAVINRKWKKGDRLELEFPMDVKKILANDNLTADKNRVALQRGPLIYCLEGVDNDNQAWNATVPDSLPFDASYEKDLLNGVVTLKAEAPVDGAVDAGASTRTHKEIITAIPYYAWANRGKSRMLIWLPRLMGGDTSF